MIRIAPSLLAADILSLGNEARRALSAGADMLHIDVMDGHFVPNLSFGPSLVAALHAAFPKAVLDVHLMLEHPTAMLDAFLRAGAHIVTVHAECLDAKEAIERIRAAGRVAGISVRPGTPVEAAQSLLPLCGQVLVMTVEPGFGGQAFMPAMMDKVRLLRQMGYRHSVEVDGGINETTARAAIAAGANILVMGTAMFAAEHLEPLIASLKKGETA